MLAVVEGVEVEGNFVVAEDVFAARHAGAGQARSGFAQESGVEVVVVPGNPADGLAARGLAVGRLVLAEVGDAEEARNFAAGEKILQLRRVRNFADVDVCGVEPRGEKQNGEGGLQAAPRAAAAFWMLSRSSGSVERRRLKRSRASERQTVSVNVFTVALRGWLLSSAISPK